MRHMWIGALLLLLCLCSGFAGQDEAGQSPVEVGTRLWMKVPDFHLPLVGSERLQKVNLYDYVGHYDVVMLYFFSAAS